jgi:hypothetical protein
MNKTWIAKTRGQIERLNHKLSVVQLDDALSVSHSEYGFLTILTDEDEDPVQLVRECLTERAEND